MIPGYPQSRAEVHHFCRYHRPRSLHRVLLLRVYCLLAFALLVLSGCGHQPGDGATGGHNPIDQTRNRTTAVDSIPSEPVQITPRIRAICGQIESLVHSLRRDPSLADGPVWVRAHALLVFRAGVSRTSEEENIFQSLVDGVVRIGPTGAFRSRAGRPVAVYVTEGFDGQHHVNQILHLLAVSGVDPQRQIKGSKWLVRDLITTSYRESRTDAELPWTLSAWSTYESDDTLTNKFGEAVSLQSFAEASLNTPDPTCGGSHWYQGLARTFSRLRLQNPDLPLTEMLELKLDQEIDRLEREQHRDGSLMMPPSGDDDSDSEPASAQDDLDRILYTGHSMEWISLACDNDYLAEPWVLRACEVLIQAISREHFDEEQPIISFGSDEQLFALGNMMHALSGLITWRQRIALNERPSLPDTSQSLSAR